MKIHNKQKHKTRALGTKLAIKSSVAFGENRGTMNFQKTIRSDITVEGIGLHTGRLIQLTLKPAQPNEGIHFVRTDLPANKIKADYRNVVNTQLATTIGAPTLSGDGMATVSTVEHVMAAVAALDLDNLTIEINGPEVPVMDGSSEAFVKALQSAGFITQLAPRMELVIKKTVEIQLGDKVARIEPAKRFEIAGTIDWKHPLIGRQEFTYREGRTAHHELLRARTFCMAKDIEMMKAAGLIKGGSLDNALVFDNERVVNEEGLRYEDECVRHKVLDALGDLKLAGYALVGKVTLHKAGHDVHNKLLHALMADPSAYEIRNSGVATRSSQRSTARVAQQVAAATV